MRHSSTTTSSWPLTSTPRPSLSTLRAPSSTPTARRPTSKPEDQSSHLVPKKAWPRPSSPASKSHISFFLSTL
ncbi:hypothetical protein ACFX12_002831 [Malus domestica]